MSKKNEENYKDISISLLNWYDFNRRNLPWRALPEEKANPYFVFISEIMLQQTVVATVIPYFNKFIKKWPTINHIAKADFQEVSSLWSGLGYYRRAKNLHETAKIISKDYNGVIPNNKETLLTFPGIGEYTASAIIAIAFNMKSNVVDGNIERIFSRLYKIEKPIKLSKQTIRDITTKHLPSIRNGDYVQALMDLGSSICIAKTPRCKICPIFFSCKVGGKPDAINYPKKIPKKKKRQRYGLFFCLIDYKGLILFSTNNDNGLLANMDVLPSIGWYENKDRFDYAPKIITKELSLFNLNWIILGSSIDHIFTHFKLNCTIAFCRINKKKNLFDLPNDRKYRFVKKGDLNQLATPSLIKKMLKCIEDEDLLND